jgi:hypothetical protein
MIKQILIEEGGFTSSYLKVKEKVKKLCEESKEDLLIIPAQRLVKDFSGKTYGIAAICKGGLDNKQIERIKLFLESFAIDYQHKLLNLNFCVFENMNL